MSKRLVSSAKRQLRLAHRRYVFSRAIAALIRDPLHVLRTKPELLDQLIYGWNNEAWSSDSQYLNACVNHAAETPGPILECGSGLSTIVIGAVAKSQGKRLWALEHAPEWMTHVKACLDKYSVDSVTICHTPLRRYADFEWYDAPIIDLPSDFGLVICDGPPGDTLGGRFGLLPIMRDSLADGCTILLDDAHRPAERKIIKRWRAEYGVEAALAGDQIKYANISIPSH